MKLTWNRIFYSTLDEMVHDNKRNYSRQLYIYCYLCLFCETLNFYTYFSGLSQKGCNCWIKCPAACKPGDTSCKSCSQLEEALIGAAGEPAIRG